MLAETAHERLLEVLRRRNQELEERLARPRTLLDKLRILNLRAEIRGSIERVKRRVESEVP